MTATSAFAAAREPAVLGRAPRLEKARQVAALAQPRDRQADPARPRLPGPLAVAVPLRRAVGRARPSAPRPPPRAPAPSAAGRERQHLAHEIGVGLLLHALQKRHPPAGLVVSAARAQAGQPVPLPEDRRWPPSGDAISPLHHTPGHDRAVPVIAEAGCGLVGVEVAGTGEATAWRETLLGRRRTDGSRGGTVRDGSRGRRGMGDRGRPLAFAGLREVDLAPDPGGRRARRGVGPVRVAGGGRHEERGRAPPACLRQRTAERFAAGVPLASSSRVKACTQTPAAAPGRRAPRAATRGVRGHDGGEQGVLVAPGPLREGAARRAAIRPGRVGPGARPAGRGDGALEAARRPHRAVQLDLGPTRRGAARRPARGSGASCRLRARPRKKAARCRRGTLAAAERRSPAPIADDADRGPQPPLDRDRRPHQRGARCVSRASRPMGRRWKSMRAFCRSRSLMPVWSRTTSRSWMRFHQRDGSSRSWWAAIGIGSWGSTTPKR